MGGRCKTFWHDRLRDYEQMARGMRSSGRTRLFYCRYKLPIMSAEIYIAVRRLAKSPLFTVRELGTLALWVGANLTI
jgi:hypothetical protein